MNQTYKLVAFDMDGVIFENKNSWEMVHEVFKTSYNNEEIMKNPSKKKYDTVYKELIGELWKGKDTREINNKVQEAKYNPGVSIRPISITFTPESKMPSINAFFKVLEESLISAPTIIYLTFKNSLKAFPVL